MRRGILVIMAVAVALMFATTSAAYAAAPPPPDGPFLCPAAGHGIDNPGHAAGKTNPFIGQIASGQYSFLPGHNQAGQHANSHAINPEGPGTTAGPGGGNSDWSPIWPDPTP